MSTRAIPLSEALVEVSSGVGPAWSKYRVLGATRAGVALAKEPVGKSPERYKLVEPGTIFYNPMRILIGSIAMVDDGDEPGITSPDYVVFRPRPGVLQHRWFYYWLRSKYGEDLIRSLTRGAVRERLLYRRLARGRICIPTCEDQLLFGQSLARAEDARVSILRQMEAVTALEQSWLREVFSSPDAKRWPLKALGEFARLSSGATPSRGVSKYFNGDIPWVKTLDLNCGHVRTTEERISRDAFNDVRAELLPPNTVMIAMYGGGGTIGKSGILGVSATTNQAICSVLANPDVFDSEFLHYYLISIRPQWMRHSAGNRRDPNISKSIVAHMRCPLPAVDVQRRVAGALRTQMSRTDRAKGQMQEQLMNFESLEAAFIRASLA